MFLFNGDCLEILKTLKADSIDSLLTDPPAGIGFMGKEWDRDKGGRDSWIAWMTDVMAECYRVLKPGAHGLVWAIPRTSHWTATALENAGFEVRDVITHLFGSGFPKSLNISKAIDKAAGAEREVVGKKSTYRKPQAPNGWDCSKRAEFETAPATEAAKQWDGWGTALKPASEHWILVRKPISEKTVAANVLKWGTGGINIDECRIGLSHGDDTSRKLSQKQSWKNTSPAGSGSVTDDWQKGRFPANLVLSHTIFCGDECADDCPVKMLDEQSGFGDKGGASRFFYVAKASKKDRGEGNNHPTVKPQKLMQYLAKLITPPNGIILDPFMGSGSTGVAAINSDFRFKGIEQDKNYFQIAEARIYESFGF